MKFLVAILLCAQAGAQTISVSCHNPLIKQVGDKNVIKVLDEYKAPETPEELQSYIAEFEKLFTALYEKNSPKYDRIQSQKLTKWIGNTQSSLKTEERQELRASLRVFFIRQLRASRSYSKAELERLEKRFRLVENSFSQNAPLLYRSFCLDEILGGTPEQADEFAKQLNILKQKQDLLERYSTEMETELVKRIQAHPKFEDHWYHYAAFLFARGRLIESEKQLGELFRINPKHPLGLKLAESLEKVKEIKDPLEQSRTIRQIVKTQVKEANEAYQKSRKRQPAKKGDIKISP